MNIERLREQLKVDEGVKYEVYKDHLGYLTFGIGHLITPQDPEYGKPEGTPVSEERVNEQFAVDVDLFIDETQKIFPSFDKQPDEIQEVLVNMCFNLGRPRLEKFKNFIAFIESRDYNEASLEMLDSRWAEQVGSRAQRLSDVVLRVGLDLNWKK